MAMEVAHPVEYTPLEQSMYAFDSIAEQTKCVIERVTADYASGVISHAELRQRVLKTVLPASAVFMAAAAGVMVHEYLENGSEDEEEDEDEDQDEEEWSEHEDDEEDRDGDEDNGNESDASSINPGSLGGNASDYDGPGSWMADIDAQPVQDFSSPYVPPPPPAPVVAQPSTPVAPATPRTVAKQDALALFEEEYVQALDSKELADSIRERLGNEFTCKVFLGLDEVGRDRMMKEWVESWWVGHGRVGWDGGRDVKRRRLA